MLLTIMLLRFEIGIGDGLAGMGVAALSPYPFEGGRFVEEALVGWLEGGVELPCTELRVEDDFCVGTVLVDSAEESEVRKLARERRRSS